MQTEAMNYIKKHFLTLGRDHKQNLLLRSNLTDREIELISRRFIQGQSLKDCAEYFGIEINSISKFQQKTINKLYNYISG